MNVFAVDTETTGLDDPRPIEIAAVCVDDFSIAFCERIKPEVPIEAEAIALHGMTRESLASCRSESEVIRDFINFLARHGARELVAHKASFDRGVIERALERSQMPLLRMPWRCTIDMSRAKLPQYGVRHKLSDCCARAGIDYKEAHSALHDAIMCARVFKNFFAPTLEDLWMDAGLSAVNSQEAEEYGD